MLNLLIAQAPLDDIESNIWVDLLVAWGPFFVIAIIIYIFVFRSLRKNNNSLIDDAQAHTKRMEAYSDRMETRIDEMIDLLRAINDKLDRDK